MIQQYLNHCNSKQFPLFDPLFFSLSDAKIRKENVQFLFAESFGRKFLLFQLFQTDFFNYLFSSFGKEKPLHNNCNTINNASKLYIHCNDFFPFHFHNSILFNVNVTLENWSYQWQWRWWHTPQVKIKISIWLFPFVSSLLKSFFFSFIVFAVIHMYVSPFELLLKSILLFCPSTIYVNQRRIHNVISYHLFHVFIPLYLSIYAK